ncbi:MAG: helix-turn-helix transcriptional regulator [Lyngbya sp. HA4199-MV5]|jgi:ATP/maltotriose-dependent transcriptional regulator MalT|nr:helix-turn-helix transcriptional regulator [Lyngbya sp. HA4199-MV5]
MTAPLLVSSLEPTALGSLFSSCAAERTNKPSARRAKQPSHHQPKPTSTSLSEASTLNLIRSSLLESLSQGVIVTSRGLNPLYWNAKARTLCQHLSGNDFPPLELPAEVSEVCHRLMRENRLSDRPFVMECQAPTGQTIRISARWLELAGAQASDRGQQQAFILVLLENCNDLLYEEIQIERKKYDLTEREAEVWMLLRQEYSYQEIAKMLQISLNTVKTHIKNVYAKKRSCQGREKFWCCD